MSAAVFADELIVVAPEADTLIEIGGARYEEAFSGFMQYYGIDSWSEHGKARESDIDFMINAASEELEELCRSHGPTWWDLPEAQLAHEDQLIEMIEALQVAKEVEGYLGDRMSSLLCLTLEDC